MPPGYKAMTDETRIKMLESLARMAKEASSHEVETGNVLADHFDVLAQVRRYEAIYGSLDNCQYYWEKRALESQP